jgi:ribosomal protein S27AE
VEVAYPPRCHRISVPPPQPRRARGDRPRARAHPPESSAQPAATPAAGPRRECSRCPAPRTFMAAQTAEREQLDCGSCTRTRRYGAGRCHPTSLTAARRFGCSACLSSPGLTGLQDNPDGCPAKRSLPVRAYMLGDGFGSLQDRGRGRIAGGEEANVRGWVARCEGSDRWPRSRRRAGYRPAGPSAACRPRASMQCPPRHGPTPVRPASGSICRLVSTTG